jgi:dsRNA-specific ribonuclease
MAAQLGVDQRTCVGLDPSDPKLALSHFCQRYCRRKLNNEDIQFATNHFMNTGFQSVVKLNCLGGQEFVGELGVTQKDAERKAAEQALAAHAVAIANLPPEPMNHPFGMSSARPHQQQQRVPPRMGPGVMGGMPMAGRSNPAQGMPMGGGIPRQQQPRVAPPPSRPAAIPKKPKADLLENAAVTSKSQFNACCMKLVKRLMQKEEITYETVAVPESDATPAGFQSMVKAPCLPGGYASMSWTGVLRGNKRDAEQSAADKALRALAAVPQFSVAFGAAPFPEVKESTGAKTKSDDRNNAVTSKSNLNATCMRILKRVLTKGEITYETTVVPGGGYQSTVRLPCLPGEHANASWAGSNSDTKKDAEQSAAEAALKFIASEAEFAAMLEQTKAKPKKAAKEAAPQIPWMRMTGPDMPRERIGEDKIDGEVIEWKGSYGWIKPLGEIKHDAAAWRGGKVYAHQQDLVGADALTAGASVRFYAYVDPTGLGAEEISPS